MTISPPSRSPIYSEALPTAEAVPKRVLRFHTPPPPHRSAASDASRPSQKRANDSRGAAADSEASEVSDTAGPPSGGSGAHDHALGGAATPAGIAQTPHRGWPARLRREIEDLKASVELCRVLPSRAHCLLYPAYSIAQ